MSDKCGSKLPFTVRDLRPVTSGERVAKIVRDHYSGTPIRTREIAKLIGREEGNTSTVLARAQREGLVRNVGHHKGWVPVPAGD